ncbi:MAG: hypothetical protein M0038_04290 [Pseudomonadota bacterium]|jgi:hypothetical protein|nr:hypothetical protein [Pseudomonadota bacterium]
MPKNVFLPLVATLTVALGANVALAAGLAPVTLDAKAISAGQIRVARLMRLTASPQISAYGFVLDPGPLVTLAADVVAARSAAAAASARAALARNEARRAVHLYRAQHNISQAALQRAQSTLAVAEAARATAVAQLAQWRTRMLADWGSKLFAAALSGSAPLPRLEKGAAQLVEVSLPLGQGLANPPAEASATTPSGGGVQLRFVSRAPRAAAGVAGESFFYLMASRASAAIGTPLSVEFSASTGKSGVLVPRSAVVWHQGELFSFREITPDSFAPVPIPGAFVTKKGYFVPEGAGTLLHPGDRVVIDGAALLYSAATQSRAATTGVAKDADDDED